MLAANERVMNADEEHQERSREWIPFQRIWTPMQSRMNEESRRMTFMAASPIARAMFSAKL
jgi:hypothetical protein